MEISDPQSHELSWDLIHGTHGNGYCKFRGSSPRRRRRTGGGRRRLKWGGSDMPSPVVEWRLNGFVAGSAPEAGGGGDGKIQLVRGGVVVGRSARKLAAGVWRNLAAVKKCGGGGGVTWHGQHDPLQFGLESHLPNAKKAMKGATKWEPRCPNKRPNFIEVCQFHRDVRFLKNHDQQVAATSVGYYALQIELLRARNRVKELETERRLFKKQLKHFLRGLGREMASSMRRERKKMHVIFVEELKGGLERERRNCERMRNVSSKLMSDLADSKLSTQRMIQEFDKEKRARELLEDLCDELGKDIQEHKTKIRAMNFEFGRIQEEVEQERKMMQLAEVWREERVQMKLVDAKLILEERYFQMNSLISDLETFLRSNNPTPDVVKTIEARTRGQAMDAMTMSIQEIMKEQCYTPHTNENLEDNINNIGTNETVGNIGEFHESQLSIQSSDQFHNISPEVIESIKNMLRVDSDHSVDDENSFRFGDNKTRRDIGDCALRSADCTTGDRCMPRSASDYQNQESLNPQTNTKISSGQKLKNRKPSLRKLWKSSPTATAADENGSNPPSMAALSPEKVVTSEEVFHENENENENENEVVSHWCLPGQRNPHITRAMRGCIEWPRGIQRNGFLKANFLLEAGVLETQKTQLRNVLKQRMK